MANAALALFLCLFGRFYPFGLSLVYPSDQSDEDSGVGALGPDRELNLWRRLA
jgi:hypothetical protein